MQIRVLKRAQQIIGLGRPIDLLPIEVAKIIRIIVALAAILFGIAQPIELRRPDGEVRAARCH